MTTKNTYPRRGERFDGTRPIADVSEAIRLEIRLEVNTGLLPRGRWSTRLKRFSQGRSITVTYTPSPAEDELFALAYYNRERIVFETEHPRDHCPLPRLSEFGQLLEERIAAKLDDFNCHYSDKNASFYGDFVVTMNTQVTHLKDMHRAGLLEQQPEIAPALSYTAMRDCWRKQSRLQPSAPAINPLAINPLALVESLATGTLGDLLRDDEAKKPHLRLVPPPPPVPREALERSAGSVPAPMAALLNANAAARPGARAKRRPIAVPVTDADLAPPNEAWLRLALANSLELDFTIPGLKEVL
jgi:hypothetical protein